MKKYLRPVVNELVADINEPICLYDSTWFGSPCYDSYPTSRQKPQLGRNSLVYQLYGYHDTTREGTYPHTTDNQWLIVVFDTDIRDYLDDVTFSLDSHYDGYYEIGNESETRIRFDMSYYSNKDNETIGSGGLTFEFPSTWSLADATALANYLDAHFLRTEIHDLIGG